ncbi:MAG: 30S ribosomal protein S20 [Acidobacteriota bacterium]
MANTRSAIKQMRLSQKNRLRNRSKLSRMRTVIRQFRAKVAGGNMEEAEAMLPNIYSIIDKTAQKGVIEKKTASRYKARLTSKIK